jgi:hypothetical protein
MNRIAFFTVFFAWLTSAFAQSSKVYKVGQCPICDTPAPKKPFANFATTKGACTTASLTPRAMRRDLPANVVFHPETECYWQSTACPTCLNVYLNKL